MKQLGIFLLIAALLFGIDALRQDTHIIVDAGVRERISGLWEAQMGRAPSKQELESLVANWVQEEMFYREALKLGLNEDDTIIRRRLVQKLGFMMQDIDESKISQDDVQAYYEANSGRYQQPARYTFSQVFFRDASQAELIKQQLREQPAQQPTQQPGNGANWDTLGETSLLPGRFVAKSEREIAASLGTRFSYQLDQLQAGVWVGPLSSSFGFHLVRLELFEEAQTTPFAQVEAKVLLDLLQAQRENALETYSASLKVRYPVVYE